MQPHITTAGIDTTLEGGRVISFAETSTRRPAILPEGGDKSNQRYFAETRAFGLTAQRSQITIAARVFRWSNLDQAEVSINALGIGEMTINLSADQLRRLASDLLDAAFDIEVNPA